MALLEIPEPKPLITVVVGKVERAYSVLLVLEPFALTLLPVGEGLDTLALTIAVHISASVRITIGIRGASMSIRLAIDKLTLIFASVRKGVVSDLYLLTSRR